MADAAKSASLIGDVASLLNAVIWPTFAAIFVWKYREQVTRLFNVVIDKVERAKTIKAVGIEIADEEIKQALAAVTPVPDATKVPEGQVQNANLLANSLDEAGVSKAEAAASAKARCIALAEQYDQIRLREPSSRERTIKLDRIVAKMRTLGLLVRPFLPSLTRSESAGERLVAIASLQVAPNALYLKWLSERIEQEKPFMLFHAALALRQCVADRVFPSLEEMQSLLQNALARIRGFLGGTPDENTVIVLKEALEALDR